MEPKSIGEFEEEKSEPTNILITRDDEGYISKISVTTPYKVTYIDITRDLNKRIIAISKSIT